MRYATALVAALALGASGLYTPSAKAGVVVGIGLPAPTVAPRIAYYPYGLAPAIGIGLGFRPAFYGPGMYGPGFVGPAFRDPGYYRPGFVRGAFAHGGYAHGGYYRGGFHR